MHAHHVPHVDSLVPRPHFSRTPEKWRKVVWARDYHVEHVESSIGRNGEARSAGETTPCMLSSAYPIHRSANKVNRSSADVQVVFCIVILYLILQKC